MLSHMTSSLLFFSLDFASFLTVIGFIATTIDTAKSCQIKQIRL